MLCILVSPQLYADSCVLNVDNAEALVVRSGSGEVLQISNGANTLEFEGYGAFYINAVEPYMINSVYNNTYGYELSSNPQQSYSLYPSNGCEYTLTTVNINEARSESFVLTVDDPEKVKVTVSGTYTTLNLQAGENTVPYYPGVEQTLTIEPRVYGTTIYLVSKNGEKVTPSYGSYQVYIEENMDLNIQVNFPVEPCTVSFEYLNDCEGIVTSVLLNNSPVTDFENGFDAMLGDNVSVVLDTNLYKFNSIRLNGGSPTTYIYGSYDVTLTDVENLITIDAARYKTFNVDLTIDNPDFVEVYRGYSYNENRVSGLTAGVNTIEVKEENTMLTIKAASGCFITSVMADGSSVSANYNNEYQIYATDGMAIEVISGQISRDKTLVLYIDNPALAEYGGQFIRADRSSIDYNAQANGYTIVKFADADLPLSIALWGPTVSYAYLNGEEYASNYGTGPNYDLTDINDGDVFKIYLAGEPTSHNVTFTIDENVELAGKLADRINPFDHSEPQLFMLGTEVSVEPLTDVSELQATLDGEELPHAEGKYVFNVSQDHNFMLKKANTGVENIAVEKPADGNVYNLQGIRVAVNGQLDKLPAGVYVVGGQKVVKR